MLGKARLLRLATDKDGYQTVKLAIEKRQVSWKVHRLVLLAFVGPPPPGKPLARHLDGDPQNNSITNLVWGDNSENQIDRIRHGTDPNACRPACSAGHVYDEANTSWRRKNGRLSRDCRSCRARRARERRARNRSDDSSFGGAA